MSSRFVNALLLAAAIGVAACVDMSAPKGPASISVLQLPALFVVRGDVMRDSAGNPAAPRVIAYDANGVELGGFTPSVFVTDSQPAAHFNGEGVLAGDRLGVVRLLGQIGNLQTPTATVAVTVAPTRIAGPAAQDTLRAPVGADTAASLGAVALRATVRGAGDTTVQGMIVRYALVRGIESASSAPAAYLADEAGTPSTADTTDASGTASRRVIVISSRIKDDALRSGLRTDSVIVEARAKYRGAELAGSPVRFKVPVKVAFVLR